MSLVLRLLSKNKILGALLVFLKDSALSNENKISIVGQRPF